MIIYKHKEGILCTYLDSGYEIESIIESDDYWFGHDNRHFHYSDNMVNIFEADKIGKNTWKTGKFIKKVNVIEI